ncbi:MAG: 3,4-dehydroadipyl-CoA semialdehyde dehydrogenase [Myxococcota bacterium]
METLESYVGGRWQPGAGEPVVLVNPATEEPVAKTSTQGLDVREALARAREVGGAALRSMTFAERGEMLEALSRAVVEQRETLLELSMINNGATRGDAKFDVDGASFTLASYARLGRELGDRRYLTDGEAVELMGSKRVAGRHLMVPRRGVAVHVNAFNFPAWGLAEKAATAWLAGMPVFSKPGTPTALVAWSLAKALVGAGALPDGAFGFLAGPAGDLVDHLEPGDVLAFTGSGATAARMRSLPHVLEAGIPVNVEADSLNVAMLSPDVEPGDEAWDLMVRDVFRDVTQKTGQKCTAIRRVLVPTERTDDLAEALLDEASRLRIGDPRADGVRMGPVVSAAQRDDVLAGLDRLREGLTTLRGAGRPEEVVGVDGDRGYFVDAHLFRAADPAASLAAEAVHRQEVFGPAATLLPYDGTVEQAAALVRLGGGGLVASVYGEDRDWIREAALELAPWSGRVTIGSRKIAAASPGPGTVLPELIHGGPGRAGNGEELGGVRGMGLYMQRVAVQGYRPFVERLF